MSALETNAEARAAFERMGRAARSGFRQALSFAGVELPTWAADRRVGRNVGRQDVERYTLQQRLSDPTDEELNAVVGAV